MTQSPIEQAIAELESVENIPVQSEDSSWRASAIDKALTALRQHREWLPVESIPRETKVLGYCAHTQEFGFIELDDFGLNRSGFAIHLKGNNKPTHWQPLPPPPQKENE